MDGEAQTDTADAAIMQPQDQAPAPQDHRLKEDLSLKPEHPESHPKLYTSIAFLKKRPDITHEQFYHHWSEVHGPLAIPWMKRHGFRSYTQYHSLPELNAAGVFAPIGPERNGSGHEDILREYDGAAVIEVDSLEAFQRAFEDEYYRKVIAEDEKLFLDKESGVLRTRAEARKIMKLF